MDAALAILTQAKQQMGGDVALILSLTGSSLPDCDINDMAVIHDKDNAYVEVQAEHIDLIENPQWLIYRDSISKLFDAVEDRGSGDIGDNWTPTNYEGAKKFVLEMRQCEGWSRGHLSFPRVSWGMDD